MQPQRIICLSAGMTSPKKADNAVARLHLYLNYGLLGLATILDQAGYESRVVHGGFRAPQDVIRELALDAMPAQAVFLSVPSSFSLPWARSACDEIRRISPKLRIVVGGRWVVADDEAWIRDQLPEANEFVRGVAEQRVLSLVTRRSQGLPVVGRRGAEDTQPLLPKLDYRLLDRMLEFQPSVEVSRGCGMGCSFCAESAERLSDMKSADVLVKEFSELVELYRTNEIHPYLEASFFRPSRAWIGRLRTELRDRIALQWRAETRVDAISPVMVAELAELGLKVLDLGLESGSPLQLVRMRKTERPDIYLRRASQLLKAAKASGVWVKVNVLLHPGETADTLCETEEWLDRHREAIKGVSVGPTILFRYGSSTAAMLEDFKTLGATEVDPASLDRHGFSQVHLSKEISHTRAVSEALRISQEFMTARDYYDLKSFSYFPRGFSWAEFCRAVAQTPDASYSFRAR